METISDLQNEIQLLEKKIQQLEADLPFKKEKLQRMMIYAGIEELTSALPDGYEFLYGCNKEQYLNENCDLTIDLLLIRNTEGEFFFVRSEGKLNGRYEVFWVDSRKIRHKISASIKDLIKFFI